MIILSNPHDIIEFFPKTRIRFSDEFRSIYENGATLRSMAEKFGVSAPYIKSQLIKGGVVIRSHKKYQKKKRVRSKNHYCGGIPYGYCMLDGKLVVDPNELKIVRMIMKQWGKVKNFSAIAYWLNGQGIPSKMKKKWNGNGVASVVRSNLKKKIGEI